MLTIACIGFLVLIGYLWWRWFLGEIVQDYLERQRRATEKEVYSSSDGEHSDDEHSPSRGNAQKRQDYSDDEVEYDPYSD